MSDNKGKERNDQVGKCIRCGGEFGYEYSEYSEFILPDEGFQLCSGCVSHLYDKITDIEEAALGLVWITFEESDKTDETEEVEEVEAKKATKKVTNKQEKHPIKQSILDLYPIQELEKNVLEYIVGQDDQVRRIITAIYRAIELQDIKSNIFVVGGTGTGKTATIERIAEELDIPCTKEDATDYTEEGYVGLSVNNMVNKLLQKADNNVERAQRGIIIVDEIDKKAGQSTGGRDVSGKGVLQSMLKLIEGKEIPLSNGEVFDTSNLIIIFMGACEGLNSIRMKRIGKKEIGFKAETEEGVISDYTKEDLINFGFTREFAGRINTIVEMNDLKLEDLVSILKSSEFSIFKKYERELGERKITLEFSSKIYEEVAKEAVKRGKGARELSDICNYIFDRILYEIFLTDNYSSCKLLQGIVRDNTKFELT